MAIWNTASIAARYAIVIEIFFLFCAFPAVARGPAKPERARDVGVPFDGVPGKLNAITDVRGVEVGHRTIVEGEGKLVVGVGPVRTGVTAILPLGRSNANQPVPAAVFSLN